MTKIHIIAEIKLEELEETGLSREEILDPKTTKEGYPLSSDPFFRYIKENRFARELLIGPYGQFSPDAIVKVALR